MRIAVHQPAPDFEAEVFDAPPLRLSRLRGKPVWLAFFRYAGCPLCNLRVHQMIGRFAEWQHQGLQMVAVFQAPAEEVRRNVGKQRAPFPIVCDPDERLYQLYGLEASLAGYVHPANLPLMAQATAAGFLPGTMHGTKTRLPADFLIDADGTVREVFYAETIGAHIPFERVDAFLQQA